MNQKWGNFVMSRCLQFLDYFRKIRNRKLIISGDAVFTITYKITATKTVGRFGTEVNKRKKLSLPTHIRSQAW
jgi:hypothetical protein